MLAWLWYFPGFALIADLQYKRIARSRYGDGPRRKSA
jgi:hypothetical protein